MQQLAWLSAWIRNQFSNHKLKLQNLGRLFALKNWMVWLFPLVAVGLFLSIIPRAYILLSKASCLGQYTFRSCRNRYVLLCRRFRGNSMVFSTTSASLLESLKGCTSLPSSFCSHSLVSLVNGLLLQPKLCFLFRVPGFRQWRNFWVGMVCDWLIVDCAVSRYCRTVTPWLSLMLTPFVSSYKSVLRSHFLGNSRSTLGLIKYSQPSRGSAIWCDEMYRSQLPLGRMTSLWQSSRRLDVLKSFGSLTRTQ